VANVSPFPQVSLSELVRIESDSANVKIEFVHGVPVYRLRGRLLPLVYLDQALRLERSVEKTAELGSAATIVVLQADDRQFGLVVDEIIDTEEIVVKPLGKKLKGVNIFAGATIMGDGRVALIIEVLGLAQRANIVSEGTFAHPCRPPGAHGYSFSPRGSLGSVSV
jgi:two-component system chemotaxis sensor kinase CheA